MDHQRSWWTYHSSGSTSLEGIPSHASREYRSWLCAFCQVGQIRMALLRLLQIAAQIVYDGTQVPSPAGQRRPRADWLIRFLGLAKLGWRCLKSQGLAFLKFFRHLSLCCSCANLCFKAELLCFALGVTCIPLQVVTFLSVSSKPWLPQQARFPSGLSPCCLQKALNCQQPRQQRREASMEDVFIEIYHVQMERKTCGWLAKKDEIRLEKADEREREGERYIYI